ncbi:hypothetical protein MFFC18_47680 [Mariniblastus fucicola]|uniref:Uncharacterized protein n=2 Tax=Mariniblastus fucicola TaxID=980251 RepID=A0A5B9PHT4_9BACT|nr:hypothetical protein MFFC18_47680 [Mariniblastus fucicola]
MLEEIERLGESPERIKWVAREENLEFARFFLGKLTESSQLFDKWFPRLKEFEDAKRSTAPNPADGQFSANDLLARQILAPKIAPAERVPQSGNFCAAFFTAPLSVLPLVRNEWPSEYRNAVFLTPVELREWNTLYDEPEDAQWWYCFQNWDVEFDPSPDSFWLEHSEYAVPVGAKSAIATWGLSWGSLAGGVKAELWAIENDSAQLLGLLGDATF